MLSAAAEAAVEDGVGGQHRLAGLQHPLEHRVGEHDLLVVAAPVAAPPGHQLALVVDQEDDAVVGGEQLEGDREDLVQQALLVALEAHLPVELVGDAQLLVVLAEGRRRPSAARRGGTRSPRPRAGPAGPGRPAAACAEATTVTPGAAAAGQRRRRSGRRAGCCPSAISSPSLRRSSRTRRPFTKVPLEQPRSLSRKPFAHLLDGGVLLGDLAIGEAERVRRVPAQRRPSGRAGTRSASRPGAAR